jgi:hypothetical protein
LRQRSGRALCTARPRITGTFRRCLLETSEISGEFNDSLRKYLDFPANSDFHDRLSPKYFSREIWMTKKPAAFVRPRAFRIPARHFVKEQDCGHNAIRLWGRQPVPRRFRHGPTLHTLASQQALGESTLPPGHNFIITKKKCKNNHTKTTCRFFQIIVRIFTQSPNDPRNICVSPDS